MKETSAHSVRSHLEQKLNNQDAAIIIFLTIAGYPLLASLLIYTDYPSSIGSLVIRTSVILISALLIIELPQPKTSILSFWLYIFFGVYILRLVVDLSNNIPQTLLHATYFFLTIVLPSIAISRVSLDDYGEKLLVNFLVIFGGVAAFFLLVPTYIFTDLLSRSLYAETGRISYNILDPISIGHVAVSCIIATLDMYCLRKQKKRGGALIFIVLINLCLLIGAAAKGPILQLLIVLLFWALFWVRDWRKQIFAISNWVLFWVRDWRRLIFFSTILLFLWTTIQYVTNKSSLSARFLFAFEDQSTISRLELQANGISQLIKNLFFGEAHLELSSMNYPHNVIIESGMALGIPGLILFLFLMIAILLKIIRLLKSGKIVIPLLLLQYLIASQLSGALFFSSSLFLLTAVVFTLPSMRIPTHLRVLK